MERPALTVDQFFKEHAAELQMKLLTEDCSLKRIIREPTVNRPGLALSGFTRYFAYMRVQVMGFAEVYYLRSVRREERETRYAYLFAYKIPCIVFSRNLKPDRQLMAAAAETGVPLFQTPLVTMKFINLATLALEMMFAPRATELGSMVDILGVGVIIRGESGIGKSEAVLALIERGYSLVADDVVKATLVDGREVLCTSAELTRDHMEVRGIGIINVGAMFGVKAIRKEKTLNVIITLRPWEDVQDLDRLGMEQEFVKVLDVDIPHVTIPVRPGRDIARLIEVAAFQIKLRKSGYNAAEELNKRLLAQMASKTGAPPCHHKFYWRNFRQPIKFPASQPMSAKQNDEGEFLTKELTIANKSGIHARPAAMFVKVATRYGCDIFVEKDGEKINGKSIMGLMMLAAGPGSKVTLHAKGADANTAIGELEDLVKRKFDEE